jgi:hypothetical protein
MAGGGGRAARVRLAAALAVVGCGFTAGCVTPSLDDPARIGPFHTAANHTGVAQLPFTLRRVLLMPVAGGSVAPEESTMELNPVFATELQKQNRFEVVTLTREECRRRFHAAEFSSVTALPHDFVATVQREYGADGVLFVDVTAFKPYRPLALGVRAKLAAFDGDVRLLWSFDNVFSATDADVANGARNHYLESDRHGVPADFTQGALQSPSRFAGYIAAEMFETLPPVYTPARASGKK